MALREAPVGNAGDGVDPGCDGREEVLEDVLAAAVLIKALRASAFFQSLPLAAPPARHTSTSSQTCQGLLPVVICGCLLHG